MLREALALYRKNFGAFLLAAGLAILPANLLMTGAVVFGLGVMGVGGVGEVSTHTEQVQEKKREFDAKPPRHPGEQEARSQQLGREAFEGKAAFNDEVLRNLLPISYAVLVAVAIMVTGLSFAQAVTGLILAMGFSFAIPAAMSECRTGREAIERSWSLCRRHWGALASIWAVFLGCSALASAAAMATPPGPWRSLISGMVRALTWPVPLAAMALLYRSAVSTSAGAPHPDSSAPECRGSPAP
jgi:hypothetical protein